MNKQPVEKLLNDTKQHWQIKSYKPKAVRIKGKATSAKVVNDTHLITTNSLSRRVISVFNAKVDSFMSDFVASVLSIADDIVSFCSSTIATACSLEKPCASSFCVKAKVSKVTAFMAQSRIGNKLSIANSHNPVQQRLTTNHNETILNGMSFTALAIPQWIVEIDTLNKYTGVNAPLIGFFYDRTKAFPLFMVECVSLLLGWFPVFHSINLHTLPPNSIDTDGGSFFNLQETI